MRILLVSSYLPYPLFSGGHVRLYNILKELSKNHEITLVCEKRLHQTASDIKAVEKICKKVVTVNRKKQWSLRNITKAGTTLSPFLVVGHTNPAMRDIIEKELEGTLFDVIHVETFYVLQNVPKTAVPIVLAEHNIEYLVYKLYAKKTPLPFRPFVQLDVEKLKIAEKKAWKRADRVVVVSDTDKKVIGDAVVVQNGVNLEEFTFENGKLKETRREKRVLFIGDFKWVQNRDAVAFIIKDIWPAVTKAMVDKPNVQNDLKLWVVGKNIPENIKNLTINDSIIFDERASQKTSEIFKQSFLLLAPIRVGGGTSFKILEAMASGVPVVTTKLGIEGIAAKDNVAYIADSAFAFAKGIEELVSNSEKYEAIAKSARKLIEEKYDWKKIVKTLENLYQSVVS